jgi:hypothetical protein
MVDLRKLFSPGRLSGRKIFLLASSFIVACFSLTVLVSPAANAADATWQGSALSYAGKQFIKTADAGDNDPRKLPGGGQLEKGTVIYTYVEPNVSGSSNPTQKAHLIYFAPGTDPTKATAANYITYDYTPPNTYANPSNPISITLEAQPTNGAAGGQTTSCALEGVGWFICPITRFLASAMDLLFDILKGFLTVRPVQTSQDNPLFRMWSVMRNFANVAFVIAFLVVIYSQVTSMGISKYGIKTILPRLIAAAILVNISYWICAIAVDLSNIFGNSLQDLFISMRSLLVGEGGNGWDVVNLKWENITGFVLSAGTAGVLLGIGASALLAGSVSGAAFLLVPVLVVVLTSVLVALLVMALRQALITVLIIVAPLAFVAYLLPNTEKYFEKWRDLFITMLMMYPILSVIFGGSQLAGMAIIQNADSINLIILGMAVQVAPIVVTPLIVKFSGALLTRFAGMVNNPNKGLIDRTRNWARDRAEDQKASVLGKKPPEGWRGAMARRTQNMDAKRRKREGNRAAGTAMADARWAGSQEYSDIQQKMLRAGLQKQTGETSAEARFEGAKARNGNLQQMDIDSRMAKVQHETAKTRADANWEELRAGNDRTIIRMSDTELATRGISRYDDYRKNMVDAIKSSAIEEGIEKRREHSAEHIQQHGFAKALLSSEELRQRAGGIDPHGADSALAAAVTADRKAYGDSVNEAHQVLKHFNPSGSARQKLAMGESIKVTDSSGFERVFTKDDVFMREAAIEAQMKGAGNFKEIEQIILASGGDLKNFKTTIRDEIVANKLADKAAYLGGRTIDLVGQGKISGDTALNQAVAETIAKGKIKPEQLATMDVDAIKRVLTVAETGNQYRAGLSAEEQAMLDARIRELGVSANTALTNTSLKGRVADNVKDELKKFVANWPPPTP